MAKEFEVDRKFGPAKLLEFHDLKAFWELEIKKVYIASPQVTLNEARHPTSPSVLICRL